MVLHAAALRSLRFASWLAVVPLAFFMACANGTGDATDSVGDPDAGGSSAGNTGSTVYDSGGTATNPASGDDDSGSTAGNTSGSTGGDGGAGEGGTGGQACTSASTCPGVGAPNCAVACTGSPSTCTFTCSGENYDVNGVATDGCEVPDSPLDNHTQAKAISVGSYGACDGDYTGSISGVIPSDAVPHLPLPDGFNTTKGYAPDEFMIVGTGAGTLCYNDVDMKLQITGTQSECYQLTVITDKSGVQTCQTNVSGTCEISDGSGSYSSNTQIIVAVDKTCSTAFPDDATYTVTGHL